MKKRMFRLERSPYFTNLDNRLPILLPVYRKILLFMIPELYANEAGSYKTIKLA
jgi:hypothetical protein